MINESIQKSTEDLSTAKSTLEDQLQSITKVKDSLEKASKRKTQMEKELEDLRLDGMTLVKDIMKQKEENLKMTQEKEKSAHQKKVLTWLDNFEVFSYDKEIYQYLDHSDDSSGDELYIPSLTIPLTKDPFLISYSIS